MQIADVSSVSLARFQAVIDALPDVVYRSSRDGMILDYWVGQAVSPFRGTAEGLVGHHISEFISEEATAILTNAIGRTLETGEVVTAEFEMRDGRGRVTGYRQVRYARSGADEVVGLTRDTTAECSRDDAHRFVSHASRMLMRAPVDDPRADVERVLRDASRFVGALGMSVFIPTAASGLEFELLYEWSELGPSPTERLRLEEPSWLLQTLELLDAPTLLHADDVPPQAGRVREVLEQYGLHTLGYIPTGSADRVGFLGVGFTEQPAHVARLRFDELGGLGAILGSVIERRRAERQRRDAEARLHSLVEQSTEVIAVLDRNGQRTYVTGEPEPVDGGPAPADTWGSVVIEDRKAMEEAFRTALRSPGTPIPVAYRRRDVGGPLRELVGTFTNLLDVPAVAGVVLNARDVTEQRAAHDALEFAARQDTLTGLPNRLAFVEHVAERLSERAHAQAVLLIDLDHFKRINDGFGHTAGDEVLRTIAMRLTELMGAQGIVARFAGDEFVVAMPIATEHHLHEFAESLRSLIAEPVTIGSASLRITASIGALLTHPGANVETLLRDADIATYTAKKHGRDRHVLCDDSLRDADAPPHRARDEPHPGDRP